MGESVATGIRYLLGDRGQKKNPNTVLKEKIYRAMAIERARMELAGIEKKRKAAQRPSSGK